MNVLFVEGEGRSRSRMSAVLGLKSSWSLKSSFLVYPLSQPVISSTRWNSGTHCVYVTTGLYQIFLASVPVVRKQEWTTAAYASLEASST